MLFDRKADTDPKMVLEIKNLKQAIKWHEDRMSTQTVESAGGPLTAREQKKRAKWVKVIKDKRTILDGKQQTPKW